MCHVHTVIIAEFLAPIKCTKPGAIAVSCANPRLILHYYHCLIISMQKSGRVEAVRETSDIVHNAYFSNYYNVEQYRFVYLFWWHTTCKNNMSLMFKLMIDDMMCSACIYKQLTPLPAPPPAYMLILYCLDHPYVVSVMCGLCHDVSPLHINVIM